MSEHHGIDLDALFKANGGHSVFAPSGSYMWLICSGSLIPNLMAPDDAGVDAAYGTVGHSVGEEWLLRIEDLRKEAGTDGFNEDMIDEAEPNYLLGRIVTIQQRTEDFDIEIDEDMIAYVRKYIVMCSELPGTHYIETRNDFSQLTPIPNQGGTADHAACEPGLLTITDLKMGKGEQVFAAVDIADYRALVEAYEGGLNGNPQLLIYALAFFYAWDWLYDFQTIVIRIAQPRLDHFQTWTTTREELLKFAEHVRTRAALAWVQNADRTPSKKGCRWCKVKGTCAARLIWLKDARESDTDGVFDPVDDDGVIEGEFTVVKTYTSQEMAAATLELEQQGFDPSFPAPGEMTTAALAKLYPHRKITEDFFKGIGAELTKRAKDGEKVPGHKLVKGRDGNRDWIDEEDAIEELEFVGLEQDDLYKKKLLSPAQAEEMLKVKYGLRPKDAAQLIRSLVTQAAGKETLVSESDKREELEDLGSVFDDVSGDDL